jgi:hypothetical protein
MEVLRKLKETREVWKMIEGESQRTLKKLETDIMKLRMVVVVVVVVVVVLFYVFMVSTGEPVR